MQGGEGAASAEGDQEAAAALGSDHAGQQHEQQSGQSVGEDATETQGQQQQQQQQQQSGQDQEQPMAEEEEAGT